MFDEFIVCRCEDVTLADIAAIVAECDSSADSSEIKRRCRIGMGWCQGRVCGPALAQILESPRPLARNGTVRPVLIRDVASADDDATDDEVRNES